MDREQNLILRPPEESKETAHPASPAETVSPVPDPPLQSETEKETTETISENILSGAQEKPEERSLLRYGVRAGLVLLGIFAVLLSAVLIIDSTANLWERGLDVIALGELFGGTVVVSPAESSAAESSIPTPDRKPLADHLTVNPPANEHEAETDGAFLPPNATAAEGEEIAILSADLSAEGKNGISLINETPYTPSLSPTLDRAIPTLRELYESFGDDAPVVLILHTHGTESYAADRASYTTEDKFRSTDPQENILAVGKVLAETLTAQGINVIFCEEMFDAEDYTMAYYNASLAIRSYLEKYPSISYIFDLHRDSIQGTDSKTTIRPVTGTDTGALAQVMFVVGTDHGGSGHKDWADNFRLACRLQAKLHETNENLMRPINLRSASFNQQYTKGSLLLEMGAVGSSVEEACAAARIVGNAIAGEIIGE